MTFSAPMGAADLIPRAFSGYRSEVFSVALPTRGDVVSNKLRRRPRGQWPTNHRPRVLWLSLGIYSPT